MASRANIGTSRSEYKFLEKPSEDLLCLICLGVSKEPLQHEACGKLFCKECLERHGKNKPCPNCRDEKSKYFVDNKSRRTIQALGVRCDYADLQCKWIGTVETLEKHLTVCKKTVVSCPKKCRYLDNTINNFMRKEVAEHLRESCPNRDYRCEFCGEDGSYMTITQSHESVCEMKVVACPVAQCKKTMQRRLLNDHISAECDFTIVSCKYEGIGCDAKLKRQEMCVHEQDDRFHLIITLQATTELQNKVASLEISLKSSVDELKSNLQSALDNIAKLKGNVESSQNDITHCEDKYRTLKQGEPFIFKIAEYQSKLVGDEIFSSVPFYAFPNGYRMLIKVYPSGCSAGKNTHVSVFACFLEGKYDAGLDWPVIGTITFTLMNQSSDSNHHSMVLDLSPSHDALVGSDWGFNQFIAHTELDANSENSPAYLVDNTLYIRVAVSNLSNKKTWLECTVR